MTYRDADDVEAVLRAEGASLRAKYGNDIEAMIRGEGLDVTDDRAEVLYPEWMERA